VDHGGGSVRLVPVVSVVCGVWWCVVVCAVWCVCCVVCAVCCVLCAVWSVVVCGVWCVVVCGVWWCGVWYGVLEPTRYSVY
jgi:hypothetical protein